MRPSAEIPSGQDHGISRRAFIASTALAGAVGLAGGVVGDRGEQTLEARTHLPYYTGYAPAIHDGRRTPPRQARVEVVWSGDPDDARAALTFDDGPMPEWTPEVLDALARLDAPATFFLRGDHVEQHADLLAPHRDRHEFGNHSWDHPDMARLDYAACVDQLTRTSDAIERNLGSRPTLVRPPYGHLAGAFLLACNDLRLTPVLWSAQLPESDFRDDPDRLVGYVAEATGPGAIVLGHDTGGDDRRIAIDRLAQIVDAIRGNGLALVRVSDLISRP